MTLYGAAHPNWKGDQVGYSKLHIWVEKTLGKPMMCAQCGTTDRKIYHWANLSGEYKRDPNDWMRLCIPCHFTFDGVLDTLREINSNRTEAHREAISRGSYWGHQTHCKNGHEFNAENTHYVEPNSEYPRGRRECMPCKKIRSRNSYLRRKK